MANHISLPHHSNLYMIVHIIEKIYHRIDNPSWCTPFRTDRENYLFRELAIAMSDDCNVNIKGVDNINSLKIVM